MELPPVRIPRERVGVVIGPHGATKAEIEGRSGVVLRVESESGEVWIDAAKAFEPALALEVVDVVKAIGRGFAPDRAMRLFQEDSYLEIHELEEMAGKRAANLELLRSRLIGTNGRTRITIEEMTGVYLSIYGKTVCIIGEVHELQMAREAVEMLARGAPHNSVYKFLEKKRRELRLRELGLA